MARTTPTPNELLTIPTYAKPDRVDELVTRSQPRPVDPFDLPPPTGGAAPSLPAGTRSAARHQRDSAPQHPENSRRLNPDGQRVRKAVFPVAGLGTRLLPATKSIPKEMITIVDRPLIQYAVDEAREAGIEQLIFVTGRGKAALGRLFRHRLRARDDDARARARASTCSSRRTPASARSSRVRQQQPLGLGHAVWCARDIVGDEPFAVLLPDELMFGKPNCLAQMVEAYEQVGGNIVAALEVPDSETHKYGVIDPGATDGRLTEIRGMVEKPAPGTAPSNLMLPGRYILQPEVMRALDAQETGAGRRNPAHRRDGQADRQAAVPRLSLRRRALRLRQRGRLRDRQSGDGPGARGCRPERPRVYRERFSLDLARAGRAARRSGSPVRPRAHRASHCPSLQAA